MTRSTDERVKCTDGRCRAPAHRVLRPNGAVPFPHVHGDDIAAGEHDLAADRIVGHCVAFSRPGPLHGPRCGRSVRPCPRRSVPFPEVVESRNLVRLRRGGASEENDFFTRLVVRHRVLVARRFGPKSRVGAGDVTMPGAVAGRRIVVRWNLRVLSGGRVHRHGIPRAEALSFGRYLDLVLERQPSTRATSPYREHQRKRRKDATCAATTTDRAEDSPGTVHAVLDVDVRATGVPEIRKRPAAAGSSVCGHWKG